MSCQTYCDCYPREDECDCTEERLCTACGRLMQIRTRRTSPPPCPTNCACPCACSCKTLRPRIHVGQCKVWNTNCPPRTTPSMEERFKELVVKWSQEIRQRADANQCGCSTKVSRTSCCNCDEEPVPSCGRPQSRPRSSSLRARPCSGSRRSCSRTMCVSVPWEDDPANNCRCPTPQTSGLKLWKGFTLKFCIGSKGVVGSPEVTVKNISNHGQGQSDSEKDEDLAVQNKIQCTCDAGDDSTGEEEEVYFVRKIIRPKCKHVDRCYCEGNRRRVSIDEPSFITRRGSIERGSQERHSVSMHPDASFISHGEQIVPEQSRGSMRSHSWRHKDRYGSSIRGDSRRSKASSVNHPIPEPYYDNDDVPYNSELPMAEPYYESSHGRHSRHSSNRPGSLYPNSDGQYMNTPHNGSNRSLPPLLSEQNDENINGSTHHSTTRSQSFAPQHSSNSRSQGHTSSHSAPQSSTPYYEGSSGRISSHTSGPHLEGSSGRMTSHTSGPHHGGSGGNMPSHTSSSHHGGSGGNMPSHTSSSHHGGSGGSMPIHTSGSHHEGSSGKMSSHTSGSHHEGSSGRTSHTSGPHHEGSSGRTSHTSGPHHEGSSGRTSHTSGPHHEGSSGRTSHTSGPHHEGSSGRTSHTSGSHHEGSSGNMPSHTSGQHYEGSSGNMPSRTYGPHHRGSGGNTPSHTSGQHYEGSSGRMSSHTSDPHHEGNSGKIPSHTSGQHYKDSSAQVPNHTSGQHYEGSSGKTPSHTSGQHYEGSSGKMSGRASAPYHESSSGR